MVVFHRTEKVFKNIVLFWVLCALDKGCTEPIRTLDCNMTKLFKTNEYAGNIFSVFSDLLPGLCMQRVILHATCMHQTAHSKTAKWK